MPEELEFEKPLLELENRIAELRASSDPLAARDEIAALEERLRRLQQRTYASLTPWQRTQLGRAPRENLARNFGMPHPEGFRKALRLMKLAEKFAKPVFSFIDTPGAYPGLGAEERGQAEAIGREPREMAGLRTPVIAV